MSDYKQLENQLHELQKKRRLLGIEIGVMARTPKSAYNYSSAKLDDWLKQAEQLDEQIYGLKSHLTEIEPGYLMQLQNRK
jgi:hypothetical protein